MKAREPFRVLVADDEPMLLDSYRYVIDDLSPRRDRMTELEEQLFGLADMPPTPEVESSLPAEIAGVEIRLDDCDGCTVAELRDRIGKLHPGLASALSKPGVRACVEDAIVPDTHVLTGKCEVEFLPAVSGG